MGDTREPSASSQSSASTLGKQHASQDSEISKSYRSSDNDAGGHSDDYDYSKNTKSRLITDLIVHRPYVMVGMSFGLAAIFSIIYLSGALNTGTAEAGGQLLAVRELEVQWYLAHEAHDNRQLDDDTVDVRSSGDTDNLDMTLVYEATNGASMFTPQGFRAIYRNERAMVGQGTRCDGCTVTINDYTEFCALDYNRARNDGRELDPCNTPVELRDCAAPTSPLSLLFPSNSINYWDITQEDVNAITQEQIDERLQDLTVAQKNLPVPGFFLDQNYRAVDEANPNMRSKFTRSQFAFGTPLCGENADGTRKFRNKYDKTDDQLDLHEPFILQYPDFFEEDDPDGTAVFYLQGVLSDWEIQQIINGDFILAGAAGVFIFFGIWFQTRSLLIAIAGICNIGMSYPVALFFYHGVFQIEIDTSLNRLAIFIVLGIGADDIFIVMDAWKQSYHQGKNVSGNVAAQMNWTWVRAAKAMGITSFTTLFAFIMTAVSPIPMIETFGIFAAMMVLFNYLLIITFFPACVRLWNRSKYERQCCGKPIDPETGENAPVEVDDIADVELVPTKKANDDEDDEVKQQDANGSVAITVDTLDEDIENSKNETPTKPPQTNGTSGADKEDSLAAENGVDESGKSKDTLAVPEKSKNEKSKSKSKKFDPEHDVDISKYRKVEQYFYTVHAPVLYRFRKLLVAFFFVLLVLGSVGTGYISLPQESETFLPEKSELNKAIEAIGEFPGSASTSDLSPLVFFYYGIDGEFPVDREGLDPNDVDNAGVIQLDRTFPELLTIENQHGLVDICDQIIAIGGVDGPLVPRQDHICIMRDFKAFEEDRYRDETDDHRVLSDRMWAYSLLLRNFAFGLDNASLASHIGFEFFDTSAGETNIFTEREEVVSGLGICNATLGCEIPRVADLSHVTNGNQDGSFVWQIENASESNYEFVIDLRDNADVHAIEFRGACDDTYRFEYTNMNNERMSLATFDPISNTTCSELHDFDRVELIRGFRARRVLFRCEPGADGECEIGNFAILRSPSPAGLTHLRFQFAQSLGFQDALPARRAAFERWQAALDNVNANAPTGLNKAFQTSRIWAFIVTNDVLVQSTVVSILISFCIAVICLLFATGNLIVAGLASFTILGIVVTTIGAFTAGGATLDLMRSMIYVMLVGLSVDYVVHLANAVNDSPLHGRFERARHGLLDVGISVFGAALTTMGSAVFLFFGSLNFFISFGSNLFVTILLSLLWSTVGFMAFLMYLGPDTKGQGDVTQVFGFLRCNNAKADPNSAASSSSHGGGDSESDPESLGNADVETSKREVAKAASSIPPTPSAAAASDSDA